MVRGPHVLHGVWSPFFGKTMREALSRVIFAGSASAMNGALTADVPRGTDMASHLLHPPLSATRAISPTLSSRPDSPGVHDDSTFDSGMGRRPSILKRAVPPPTRARSLDQLPNSSSNSIPSASVAQPTLSSDLSPSLLALLANSPFKHRHVLSVSQYSRQDIDLLFTVAQEMRIGVQRVGVLPILTSRVLCTIFYEPSTRTSASFDTAMQRLGGRTVVINPEYSSLKKGETLQDTIRTLACYGDAIVLRHPENSSAAVAARSSPVPIINGGNGSLEHPTQAFLDLFTIREELGSISNITITFVGDLKYGRTVHSLIKLLRYYDVKINLVAPTALPLPSEVREQIQRSGQLAVEADMLTPEIIARSDVMYCTRVQKERFQSQDEYETLKDSFVVDNSMLQHAKSKMVLMHPLPRNSEISQEVDADPRAAYFRQVSLSLPFLLFFRCPFFLSFSLCPSLSYMRNHELICKADTKTVDEVWALLPHGPARTGARPFLTACLRSLFFGTGTVTK